METRAFNFCAGPATLPRSVLERARDELLALPGARASVLEISHRSPRFREIVVEARERIAALLGLPKEYRVLFLPGGASLQFSMVPMNFLRGAGSPARYVVTGSWGRKALREARREGSVEIAWSGESDGYRSLPSETELAMDEPAAYVHVTSNETIEGVQFREVPRVPGNPATPLVCDASSDFLSRPLDLSRYALLYAGAQKNVGPAGVTIVILHTSLLDRCPDDLPRMLDYRAWSEADSLLNTPCTFAIYIVGLVARWLEEEVGGLEAMQERNRAKAAKLYEAIDASGGFYRGHAAPEARSTMNVTFRLADPALEPELLAAAEARGLLGLKGHRSVGGLRASIYNAMSWEGVAALTEFLAEFRKRHGGGSTVS